MKTLWKNEIEYIGVELNPDEVNLIVAIMKRLSRDELARLGLSEEEIVEFDRLFLGLNS